MSTQAAVQTQPLTKPTITPVTHGLLQRCTATQECDECRKKREGMLLQRAAVDSSPVSEVPPIVHEVLRSPGQPLDERTRAFMEPRFGHDFSDVRVHTDAKAAESARAVNALAYTVGRDVVFGAGRYVPQTSAGQKLMAHELTHVVQQGMRPISTPSTVDEPNSAPERVALKTTEAISSDQAINLSSAPDTKIHRLPGIDDVLAGIGNAFAGAGAFVSGVLNGLRGSMTEQDIQRLANRLMWNSLLTAVFPLVFVAGAAVGIIEDVVDAVKGIYRMITEFDQFIEEMKNLFLAFVGPDSQAIGRAMGEQVGQEYGTRIVTLARGNVFEFTFGLGRMIGPTIVYTVLAFLGIPELVASAIIGRLLTILRPLLQRFPRLLRLAERIASRLTPRRRPRVDPGVDESVERGIIEGSSITTTPTRPPRPRPQQRTRVPTQGTAGSRRASIREQSRRGVGGERGPRPSSTRPKPYSPPSERTLRGDYLRRFRSRQGNTWRDTGRMRHTLDQHMPGSPGGGSKFPLDWTEVDVLEAGYHVSNNNTIQQIGREAGMNYYRGVYRGVTVRVQVNKVSRSIHSVAPE